MAFLNTVSWLITTLLKPFVDNLLTIKRKEAIIVAVGSPPSWAKYLLLPCSPFPHIVG